MNKNLNRSAVNLGTAFMSLVLGTACVNQSVFGVPLGPRSVSGGLVIVGTKLADPVTLCLMTSGAPYFVAPGRVDIAPNRASSYMAFLDVRNTLATNDRVTPAPTYGGDWGSVSSNQITLVGATLKYEFPGLSPLFRFTHQQRPSDGLLLTNGNTAMGAALQEGITNVVGVNILEQDYAAQLAADPEFSAALQTNGQVRIVVRVTLEGRTGAGRMASNEYTVEIAAMDLQSPPGCPNATLTCPNPNVCIRGQDFFINTCPDVVTDAMGMQTEQCP